MPCRIRRGHVLAEELAAYEVVVTGSGGPGIAAGATLSGFDECRG
jgi:hypothetical protein